MKSRIRTSRMAQARISPATARTAQEALTARTTAQITTQEAARRTIRKTITKRYPAYAGVHSVLRRAFWTFLFAFSKNYLTLPKMDFNISI